MKSAENYITPELEELFITQRLSLMVDMSSELPDGAAEGDSDTFGSVTIK